MTSTSASDQDPQPFSGCPVCCVGHVADEAPPYWLGDSRTTPARWRFVLHVVTINPPLPYQEAVDACTLYARVYGDKALGQVLAQCGRDYPPLAPAFRDVIEHLHTAAGAAP